MRRFGPWLQRVGIVVAVLGISKLHAIENGYDFTESARFAWSLAFVGLLLMASYGVGLPEMPRTRRGALVAGLVASTAAGVGISVAQLAASDLLLPRAVTFGAGLVLVPWALLCWSLASDGRHHDLDRDRVAVVAGPTLVATLREELDKAPERPSSVVGFLDPADARPTRISARPLCELVSATGATVVVLDREAQADEATIAQAAELHAVGIRIRTVPLFYEQWLGKLPTSELEHLSLMFDIGELHRAYYGRAKRVVDVTFGCVGLVALAVAVPVVAVGNLFANRGPLFYRQPRIGKGGQEFTILKFRSMRPDPGDAVGGSWTAHDDARITGFGQFLRTSHLDELPQVVNILRGDLSIVGPRPEQPHYVAELCDKIPFYDHRHLVRPGLSGWAQVKMGYAGSHDEAMARLQYDFYYLRRQSIGLDLRIVGRTLRTITNREGR